MIKTATRAIAGLAVLATACIAVPQRRVSYHPGYVELSDDGTALIDMSKKTSWRWFVIMILPEDPKSDELGHSFWTRPSVSTEYAGTIAVDLGTGTCKRLQRDRPVYDVRGIERRFRQRILPTSAEQTDAQVAGYTVRVVREAGRVVVQVSRGDEDMRRINLDALESKVYWIEGTDLVQTVGTLISMSTGAVYKHSGRYLRVYIRGERLFALRAASQTGPAELVELGAGDLATIRRIYQGRDMVAVDYDGRRFLFLSESEVAAYDTDGGTWRRYRYRGCR